MGFRYSTGRLGYKKAVSAGGWWDLDGTLSGCVAAYQPKGAASYAASKVNLANPGTYNATEGNAPDWDAVNGWKGDGTNDYLDTGISTLTDTWSIIYRFSNTVDSTYSCGCTMQSYYFGMKAGTAGLGNTQCWYSGNGGCQMPSSSSGVQALASIYGYLDGVLQKTCSGGGGTATTNVFIFKMGGLGSIGQLYIQAFAVYNITLDVTQIGNLTTAMNAL